MRNRDREIKVAKGRLHIIHRGAVIQITVAFLLEVMDVSTLNDTFKALKEKKLSNQNSVTKENVSTIKIKMRHLQVNRN